MSLIKNHGGSVWLYKTTPDDIASFSFNVAKSKYHFVGFVGNTS